MTKKHLVLLSTIFSMMTFQCAKAGQFDSLYNGADKIKNSQLEVWNKYFPGLEEQLRRVNLLSKKTGIYNFESQQSPVAWNVTSLNEVYINSINSGFYQNYRDPVTLKPLFPGLHADEQGVDIKTNGDVIISPVFGHKSGFEYAISVDPDTKTEITAGSRIVLLAPYDKNTSKYIDANIFLVAEGGQAKLKADDIHIFGNIIGTFSSKIILEAENTIAIVQPFDANLDTRTSFSESLPITLALAEMEVNAKNILFNRGVQIGSSFFDIHLGSILKIGQDSSEKNLVDNIYFNREVNAESSSLLQITANESVVFKENLNIHKNAQAQIETTSLKASKINVSGQDSTARFNIKKDGLLYIPGQINVEDNAVLEISLGEGAAMGATINSQSGTTSTVKLDSHAYWLPFSTSSVSNLDLSPNSYVELGSDTHPLDLDVENLKGKGGIFHLVPVNTGALHIRDSSEGDHAILLSSTGKSIGSTNYLYHTVVMDNSPGDKQDAKFYLANNGVVEAGPFKYKLDLDDFNRKGTKVWLITVAQEQLPNKPTVPDTPPDLPVNPDVPLNPDVIPDDLLPKPIGLSNTAKLVLAGISGGVHVVQSLGNLDNLRERLGEIRRTNEEGGYVLFRYDRSRLSNQSDIKSKLDYINYAVGFDKRLSSSFFLGGNINIAKARLKIHSSDGKMRQDTVGLKLYGTWFNQQGFYLDTVLSADRSSDRMNISMADEATVTGKRHSLGVGVSVETGKKINFGPDKEWFVEPQVQLSYYYIKGDRFIMSNGMKVDVEDFNSLTGRAGIVAGKDFNCEKNTFGQAYIKFGFQNEFLGKTKAYLNEYRFKDHSIGSSFYYGAGAAIQAGKHVKVYGQISRASGSKIKNDIQIRAGLKYLF